MSKSITCPTLYEPLAKSDVILVMVGAVVSNTNALLAPKLLPVNVKLLIAVPPASTNVAPDPNAIVPFVKSDVVSPACTV